MICTGLTLYQKLASGSCRFPDDFENALNKINLFTVLLDDWDIEFVFSTKEYRSIITNCKRVGPTDVNNIHKEIQKMFGDEIYNQSLLVSEIAYPELFPDYLYKK